MKIMIMTDLEGVAGVLDAENWIYPTSRYYEKAKRLLCDEVNAAAAAFLAGGFSEVVVNDGHGPGAIDPELLDSRLRLIRGVTKPVYPWGLDQSYAAFAVVGQHAKSRTPFSHLTHTGTFAVLSCAVNGFEIGEFGQCALCAAELGIPTIFAAGEQAFADEAEELAPGIVTAAVKQGLLPDGLDDYDAVSYKHAKLSAIHLAPAAACALIAAKAAEAAAKFGARPGSFAYKPILPPYQVVTRMRTADNTPPRTFVRHHESSFIGVMNQPLAQV